MSQGIADSFSTACARTRAQIYDSGGQLSVAGLEFKNDHPVRVDAGQAANEDNEIRN
jgi:hypothetical protein